VGYDDHSFKFLASVLGKPARTFSYTHRNRPTVDEHRWTCGCAAREEEGRCGLSACDTHRGLNRRRDPWSAERADRLA